MDHRSQRYFSALAMLQLLIIGMLLFGIGKTISSEIDCLKSIKHSLQDPWKMLSSWSWQFNNSGESYDFICRFVGVSCWSDMPKGRMIMSIELSGMGLRGEFPQGISECPYLTGLDLSNNHLYGSIPSNISKLISFVTVLDLSDNKFSGEIPPGIANCSYLNVLKLDNNFFTGRIPATLSSLNRLKIFTVANNRLFGPVPIFVNATPESESYANNTGLCGYPLIQPCESGGSNAKNIVEKYRFIVGFVAVWAVFFTLFLVLGLFTPVGSFIIKFMKRRVMPTPRLQSRRDNTMISMLEKFATRISILELNQATEQFSENNVIAVGETGTTYKATLSNGFCIAIKRLCSTAEHEFRLEILLLGRLRHINLVPLVGFCHDLNDRFLIYKFMPNGSLHDCLFSSKGKAKIMEWPVRARIAVGTAKGLAWLHRNRVIHRGISSKCVLLDENFNPKISDFGKAITITSDETHSSWELLLNNIELSVLGCYEQDVRSFGTVLLEFEQISHLLKEPHEAMMEQGFGDEISCFLRVAAKCLECDQGNYPSMDQVYQMLSGTTRHDAIDDMSTTTSLKSEIDFTN
ncbi:hypothetical protein DH2020_005213 [Rehmannia glutinosa]|uniref:Protein kinase domain-containing protein n=1 Tax=Rehmannia glutinosa TaxID=99300 RepID=A0ABR0W5U3_REHGL